MYHKCTESAPVACGENLSIQQSTTPTGICILGGRESTWYRDTSFINLDDIALEGHIDRATLLGFFVSDQPQR